MRSVIRLGLLLALAAGCGVDFDTATGAAEVDAASGRCWGLRDARLVCVPRGHPPPPPAVPPRVALEACAGRAAEAPCALRWAEQDAAGRCRSSPDGKLACVPNGLPDPEAPVDPPAAALAACRHRAPRQPCHPW